ncbi:glutamate--cysteine ligase [Motilibacter deserti]|uniref:Putative glutamate--cysteine ligase 2 n=1 Tax=Motilibacter deserti TaxID=2714956 RepID=A0ABX0GVD7_9ACTN|nr:carboxylate--amine ligase/circularly permuted type 2 ATP-grasp protein [Motilibacter deserti]
MSGLPDGLPDGLRAAGPLPVERTGDLLDTSTLGVEEEFHVVDLGTRELVPRAQDLLDRLPAGRFIGELHRSVVETNSEVTTSLDDLRTDLVRSRRLLVGVAEAAGLGVAATGTVPLVDVHALEITPTSRYRHMHDEYQLLAREQLICGAQVHVGMADRDMAVAVAQRLGPELPVLLALTASSPYWMGADSGYASMRSLVWQRWPTAGSSGSISTAAEHDALVADLVASGTISDPKMVYFDVRPSAHLPTLELRVGDSCPDIDTVVLLAGLFRALVRRERDAVLAGRPAVLPPAPLLRAAMWRAARSGLEEGLLALAYSPRPVPAEAAVSGLLERVQPYLEAAGDWEQVSELVRRALANGSSASQQRRAYERRGRLTDVVDLVLDQTRAAPGASVVPATPGGMRLHAGYFAEGDEFLPPAGPSPDYAPVLDALERLGPAGLRQREAARDEEQRSHGVTFMVAGEGSTRLFPVDLVPRIVPAQDWRQLQAGLVQRVRALDAFLHDVYGERAAVADGVIPGWVIDAAPGLRSSGALMRRQKVRAHISGMDLVRNGAGEWFVLEDNLRVPSGIGYAVQNRRLTRAVMGDLPTPPGLLDVDAAPALLRRTLQDAALPSAADDPSIVLLSEGPAGSAWFEHRMLGEEMGVPVIGPADLAVEDGTVLLMQGGTRRRVDVIYLRIGESELLHSAGADGRPLGPPLMAAVDAGRVALANAPGNGVGDDKAVYAFVPAMVEYYLGEKPLLSSVPTFLCGLPEHRETVLARLPELVLKPVDGYGGEGVLIGPKATEEELEAGRRQMLAAPHRWIAQETVQLSTHPAFDGARLDPRHVDLRAFVFLGEDVVVAPAALSRVAPQGSMIVNSSRGGGSKDTWLLG